MDGSGNKIMRSICRAASDRTEFAEVPVCHLLAATGIPQFLQPEFRCIVLNGEIQVFFDVQIHHAATHVGVCSCKHLSEPGRPMRLIPSTILLLAFATASSVIAQPPRGEFRPGGPGGPDGQPPWGEGRMMNPGEGRMMNPLLRVFDRNQDGVISEEEIDLAVSSLRRLDRNGDRQLDGSELGMVFGAGARGAGPEQPGRPGEPGRPEQPGRPGEPGQPTAGPGAMLDRMMQFDENGDGRLAADELPERVRAMMERLDRNQDGFIDREEFAAMAGGRGPNPAGGRPGAPGQGAPGERGPRGDGGEYFAGMIQRMDRNGDGQLRGEEIPEFLRGRMGEIDANGDGALTAEEIRIGMSRAARGGDRPDGEGRGRGGDRPAGERPVRDGDRPAGERPERDGDRPAGERPERDGE